MSCRTELHAVIAGRAAAHVLAGGRPARVIARFERSAYVANARGLACLGDARIGYGPLNALLGHGTALPSPGDEVTVTLRGAARWRPAPLPPADPARLRRALAALAAVRGRGLFAERDRHTGAVALRAWLGQAARQPPPPAVAALIGQGCGLTPAGDDLVGGALVALRAARRHATAARLAHWALARARRHTSRISRAHLACAARGEGAEALHAFIAGLIAGRCPRGQALDRLDAIGHTSGWDAAAGAALALDLAAGSG